LVVWDVPAPLGWDFTKYNDDVPAARDFLAQAGARPVTVPYRANRAVIFDSDLFHVSHQQSWPGAGVCPNGSPALKPLASLSRWSWSW
jgi:hypothetical protein